MKNLILPVCLLLLTTTAFAQAPREKEALIAKVELLSEAMINADETMLKGLTDSKLTYGHSSGTIENQDAFVSALTEKKYVFTKIETDQYEVQFTDNLALVRHEFRASVNDFNIRLGILMVWIERGNDWKLIARQAFVKNN